MIGSGTPNRPILLAKIRPRDGDLRRIYEVLGRVIERHPNLRLALDPGSQQISILGTDQTQLVQITTRIRRKFWIALEVDEPEVIYLETIRRTAEAESKFIRQIGGRGNYAHLKLRLEAVDADRGVEFVGTAKTIPGEYIPAVEQGIRESAAHGVQGREIVGVRVVLYDGSYHETDSNEMAFRTAASAAFSEAVTRADRVLLEPIMAVEIAVPEEYTEIVQRDFKNRRGRITGLEHRENSAVIHAIVPLAKMLGYLQGKDSQLTIDFLRYAEAPPAEEYGDGDAGVIVRTPRGPNPKHGFASLPESE